MMREQKVFEKRIKALAMGLILIFSLLTICGCGGDGTNGSAKSNDIKTVSAETAKRLMENNPAPSISAIGGEWVIRGLVFSGQDNPDEYYRHYYDNVRAEVKQKKGVLSENKYTEYSRVVLGISAIGEDPTDVEGYDLTAFLDEYDKVAAQGSTSAAFALIAANVAGVRLENEENYIQLILSAEDKTGAMGEGVLTDYLAMGAEALSFYTGREDVDAYLAEAVETLSKEQGENGAMSNCESTAECIEALVQLGIDPTGDERFVKNGKTLFDGLLTFYLGDGTFCHEVTEDGADSMASERALLGMDAIQLYADGKIVYEQKQIQ